MQPIPISETSISRSILVFISYLLFEKPIDAAEHKTICHLDHFFKLQFFSILNPFSSALEKYAIKVFDMLIHSLMLCNFSFLFSIRYYSHLPFFRNRCICNLIEIITDT